MQNSSACHSNMACAHCSTAEPDEFMSPEEAAFPWWPVPSHQGDSSTTASVSAYHSSVRLPDGRVGLLVDPGSYGNLVGAQWLEEALPKVAKPPTMTARGSPLQVGGVGKGAQTCVEDCCLPISLTRTDGSVTSGTFTSPVVTQSGCPALLGLRALEQNRAILDLAKKQLHFIGEGEPTLVLPPGSESFQLETAVSGHLLLPCTSASPAMPGEHHLFTEGQAEACHITLPIAARRTELDRQCQTACDNFVWEEAVDVLTKVSQELQACQANSDQGRFAHDSGFSVCLGAYTHGGLTGLTKATLDMPNYARLSAMILASRAHGATFSSLMVLVDAESPMHTDRFNKGLNTLLPLLLPRHGGGLWTELRKGDTVTGQVVIRQEADGQIAGQVHKLEAGVPLSFHPKAKHATEPWTRGHRVVLAAYTSGGFDKLDVAARQKLQELGMPTHEVQCEAHAVAASLPTSDVTPSQSTSAGHTASALLGHDESSPPTSANTPSQSTSAGQQGPVQVASQVQGPVQVASQVQGPVQVASQVQGPVQVASQVQGPVQVASLVQGPPCSPVQASHPRSSQASRATQPGKPQSRGLNLLKRVLLISIFHSTASAFLSQGWEPMRLRPLELLRSGFDDAVSRIKQNEFDALWVDVTDARQFAGQERTAQVCSRLAVLLSWAERQALPVVFAASRRTAWQHPAFQALIAQISYCSSYYSWCSLGARISAPVSAGKHKVLSTVRLPGIECRCPLHTEHVFDLNAQAPGCAKLRAEAEQKVISSIVAALGQALSATQGSSSPTDPACNDTSLLHSINSFVCAACGLAQCGPSCHFCGTGTEASGQCRSYAVPPVDPSSQCLSACGNAPECGKVDPPSPCEHFPTESKLAQKQRLQALKAAGAEPKTKSKRKIVEQDFDDCGEDLSSLSFPAIACLLDNSESSDDECYSLVERSLQPHLNAFETWTLCGSADASAHELPPGSIMAVDVEEMQRILSAECYASWGVEIVELFGGEGLTSQMCVRRRLRAGHNFELITGVDLSDPSAQLKVLGYIRVAKPLVVVMAPVCTPYGPLGVWNQNVHPEAWRRSVAQAQPLAEFSGTVAALQIKEGRYFLVEQPYPSKMFEVEPWPSVRAHPSCLRVILHQCMVGQQVSGERAKKPTELVANHIELLKPLSGLQCNGAHTHTPLVGGKARQTQKWPRKMCRLIAHGIARLAHALRQGMSDAFPSVGSGPAADGQPPAGEVPVPEAWRSCKGCLRRLHKHDPLHSRIPGQCKHPHEESMAFDCPACKARKNRSDEGHTFGPDCRHVLTQARKSAKQRRPFGRVPATTEPTAGLRASSLGRAAEQAAEEQLPPAPPVEAREPSSSSRPPASMPEGEGEPEAIRPGRGPDVEPRVRRTWQESDTQTPGAAEDWTSFDIQSSFRALRCADEAGRRRIIRKLHLRWWHASTPKMLSLLKASGLGKEVLDLVPAIVDTCKVCRTWSRPSPDAKASCRMVIGFNIEVEGDLMFYRHQGTQFIILVLVDRGVRWLATALVPDRQTSSLLTAIDRAWVAIYGPMQIMIFDGETSLDDDESTLYFQQRGITKRTSAPNQHTRIADRRIAILRDALHKLGSQMHEEGLAVPFERMVHETTFALNALSTLNGCSPYTAVLGRVPAILPSEDNIVSEGLPDTCSAHSHRLREIAVQAIAEGTARERLKRALRTQTRPSGEELDFKVGDKVDWWREPAQKDAPGWRGPGEVVDLSRLQHGRLGVRTSTDQVITCRLQDVRHSLAFLTEELSVFFGEEDHIAPAGSQASYAQQHAQSFADGLRPGSVITLGHVKTAQGEWVETPQTNEHRAVFQACMFVAEAVFHLTSVVAVRISSAVRTLTQREEYATSLLLWWSGTGSRNISFLHGDSSKTSFVNLVGQAWTETRALQFLCVPDEEGWATRARWSSPTSDSNSTSSASSTHAAAPASSTPSLDRLSTVPEEGESVASAPSLALIQEVFGPEVTEDQLPPLQEAYTACLSETAPEPHPPAELEALLASADGNPVIPTWDEVRTTESCSWATEEQLSVYLATASADEPPVLDADTTGAYVALEIHGDLCKCVEGLERLPGEGEHVELRMYEAHTRKAVIDRTDDLLTPDEVRERGAEVTQAILSELRTWQGFGCFRRRPRAEAPCVIDAKWIYKWKYVKGQRIIRARLCLRGFKESGADSQTNFASTASRFSQKLLVSECAVRGWVLASSDVPKAFLQGVTYAELAETTQGSQRDVSFELSGEGLECLQQLPEFKGFNPRLEVLHCLKPGTGCRDAPRCFSLKLRQVTELFGLKSSSVDPELEMMHVDGELLMAIIKHVDDLKMMGPRHLIEKFVRHLTATFGKMEIEWKVFTFCGVQHRQLDDGSIELDQIKFLSACKPIAQPEATSGPSDALLPETARRHFLSLLMTVAYALLTRPDIAVFVTALQRESHQARVIHVRRLNTVLKWAQANPRKLVYPKIDYPDLLLQISDSSYKAKAEDGLSVRGLVSVRVSSRAVLEGQRMTPCHILDFVSKAQRHVTRSTFSSELFAATDATDSGILHTIALHELKHGVLSPGDARKLVEGELQCSTELGLVVDAKSVSAAVTAPNVKVPAEPSLLLHVCWLRALLVRSRLRYLFWADTRSMLADALTKGACSRELIHTAMSGMLLMSQPYIIQECRR